MPAPESFTPPTSKEFVEALQHVSNITDRQIQMLRAHYYSPQRTITAKQLASHVGYDSHTPVNLQYGRLARIISEEAGYKPPSEQLETLVLFEKRQNVWHWIMREQVAVALEQLGWVDSSNALLPDEAEAAIAPLKEGSVYSVLVNAYERNPEARRRCIEAHGTDCCVCGFNFSATYGKAAEGFIHVHHLRPLADIGEEYTVDPIADLRPVCPNCHAVIHKRVPAYSIEEVRKFMHSG